MDLNAALQAARQYNSSLQKPQATPTPSQGRGNFSGALSDAQKFNQLLTKGSPAEVGQYTRNSGISALQQSGDIPTVKDATQLYQKGAEAGIDVQKAQAIEEQKRSLTTDKEQETFANAAKGWQMLDQLNKSWETAKANTNGFGGGSIQARLGVIQRGVGNLFGAQSPSYEAWQTVTHMARPIINQSILQEGKAQSGEKANIQGFEANLPEDQDTPTTKDQKLDAIRLMQWHALQSQINGMVAGGRSQAAATLMQDPTYQAMAKWNQDYTQGLQQQVTPNSYGPVNNGVTPELDAKLSATVGLKPAAQASPTPSPTPGNNTNPPGAVKANQSPASVTQQQPSSPTGAVAPDVDKLFAQIFGQ